jgi:thiol-disulfide isomerase/thioredoxin
MSAAYTRQIQAPKANFEAIQGAWLKQLESFIGRYPRADDTPEAMLQLAIAHEFAGNEPQARKWYARLAQQYPQSDQGRKAAGALKRLELDGKGLSLRGKGLDLRPVGTEDFRGKLLLVNFWASWSEPSRATLAVLQELYAKYRDKGFEIVGVNLDTDATDAANYVRSAKINWPQIYEPGGLHSRPANELGIISLPGMILVNEQGQVVDHAIELADLEAQLQRKLR